LELLSGHLTVLYLVSILGDSGIVGLCTGVARVFHDVNYGIGSKPCSQRHVFSCTKQLSALHGSATNKECWEFFYELFN